MAGSALVRREGKACCAKTDVIVSEATMNKPRMDLRLIVIKKIRAASRDARLVRQKMKVRANPAGFLRRGG
ncbi:MAG: hypothetical protein ACXWHF_00900 [Chthoniobacterales bacterium]